MPKKGTSPPHRREGVYSAYAPYGFSTQCNPLPTQVLSTNIIIISFVTDAFVTLRPACALLVALDILAMPQASRRFSERETLLSASLPRSLHHSHFAAVAATAEETVDTVGFEPGYAGAGWHDEAVENFSRPRVDVS